MNHDLAKCSGRNLLELCPTRDSCDRFVRAPSGPRQTWMMPPPSSCMGTLCVSFVQAASANSATLSQTKAP